MRARLSEQNNKTTLTKQVYQGDFDFPILLIFLTTDIGNYSIKKNDYTVRNKQKIGKYV